MDKSLTQKEVILAGMAPAKGQLLTSSQLQKLFFLIDENASARLGGPHFSFVPGDYGPYEENLHSILVALSVEGLAFIVPWNMRFYQLTERGQEMGEKLLEEIAPDVADYLKQVNKVVRSLSFSELVGSIYKAYPHMAVNAVFAK
jgi:uncharacterized protein YwgA